MNSSRERSDCSSIEREVDASESPSGATVSRRTFLVGAGGCAGAATVGLGVAPGSTSAQSALEEWLSNVPNYDEVEDRTGEDEVRVTVGAGEGFTYDPPAIRVDPGTSVVWEWTGEGGSHDVVDEDGVYESEMVGDAGHEFEHTFDDDVISLYSCTPHAQMGMKGAVLVGEAEPESATAGGSTGDRQTMVAGVVASLGIIAAVTVGISKWASAGRDERRIHGGR